MSGRLADAILVARDVYTRHAEVLERRLSCHEQLPAGHSYSNRGVLVFEGGGPSIQTAIATDAAAMREISSFPIQIKDIPAIVAQIIPAEEGGKKSPDRIMRSILLRYGGRADILLLDNLNSCWKRFAICKELAHLVMDDGQGTRAVSVEQQIAMAFSISRDPRPDRELTSEEFAWFVAVELMLPWADRLEMMSRKNSGESSLNIARSYWVPKAIIDLFFETPYGEASNRY